MPNRVENFKNPRVTSTALDLKFLTLDITKNNPSLIINKDSPVFSFNIQWSGTPTAFIFSIILEWDIRGTCFDKIPIYKLKFSDKAVGTSNTGYSILSDDHYITVSTIVSDDQKTFQLIFTYDKSHNSTIPEDVPPAPEFTSTVSTTAEGVVTNA